MFGMRACTCVFRRSRSLCLFLTEAASTLFTLRSSGTLVSCVFLSTTKFLHGIRKFTTSCSTWPHSCSATCLLMHGAGCFELDPGNAGDVLVPCEPVEEVSSGHCLSPFVPRCLPHAAGGSWGGPRTNAQFVSGRRWGPRPYPFDGTIVRMRGWRAVLIFSWLGEGRGGFRDGSKFRGSWRSCFGGYLFAFVLEPVLLAYVDFTDLANPSEMGILQHCECSPCAFSVCATFWMPCLLGLLRSLYMALAIARQTGR